MGLLADAALYQQVAVSGSGEPQLQVGDIAFVAVGSSRFDQGTGPSSCTVFHRLTRSASLGTGSHLRGRTQMTGSPGWCPSEI